MVGGKSLLGPILLENKDNIAVLHTLDPDTKPTAAHEQ
jgi:hypothetical protein